MKVTLINCYFGKLPSYFPLWVEGCRNNKRINFLLVTDADVEQYNLPANIYTLHWKWDKLLQYINEKLGPDTIIESPYKLTDYKPAYGYIFRDYLTDSDYWGYCDIDLVFGDILKFISPQISKGFDKIYRLGHLTILKNSSEMVNLFRQSGGVFSYKEVFSHKEFYSFDEHAGLLSIAHNQGIREYHSEEMADISCRVKRMTASRQNNYNYQVFYYEDGSVYRAYFDGEKIKTDEYIYIHFQKRKISIPNKLPERYYFLSDRVLYKERNGTPDIAEIKEHSEFISQRQDARELRYFRIGKIIEFVKSTYNEKKIWLKIKKAEKMSRGY